MYQFGMNNPTSGIDNEVKMTNGMHIYVSKQILNSS